MKKKQVIAYRIENGHERTHIRIEMRNEIKVSERIFQSCKDPGYYGEPDRWQRIAQLGHEVYYESRTSSEVYVSYVHAIDSGYCAHRINDVSGGLQGLAWATKLLTKVSRESAKLRDRYYGPKENYSFELDSPERIIAALKTMGAVEIEYTDEGVLSEAVGRFSAHHQFMKEAI